MWQEKLRIKRTNKLAGLYPSIKFLIVVLYSVCSILFGTIRIEVNPLRVDPGGYPFLVILWFFVVPILAAASGISKRYWKAMRAVGTVGLIILVAQSFLIRGPQVLWQLGFIKLFKGGLIKGITLGFSVLNIAGAFVWMFQTTENKELSAALDQSGLNYKVSYVFLSSLQMIQVLGQNSRTIMNAQRARGVETEGNLMVRARAFFPSLVPLVLGSITGAEERVLTLESKGFDVNCEKTHLFVIEESRYDKAAKWIAIVVAVAVLALRVMLWVL